MKTIEDLAKEYSEKTNKAYSEIIDDFKAGVEFAQRWISVKDELPENKKLCLVKIKTNNQESIEVAFYSKDTHTWYITASCYKSSEVSHFRQIFIQ